MRPKGPRSTNDATGEREWSGQRRLKAAQGRTMRSTAAEYQAGLRFAGERTDWVVRGGEPKCRDRGGRNGRARADRKEGEKRESVRR